MTEKSNLTIWNLFYCIWILNKHLGLHNYPKTGNTIFIVFVLVMRIILLRFCCNSPLSWSCSGSLGCCCSFCVALGCETLGLALVLDSRWIFVGYYVGYLLYICWIFVGYFKYPCTFMIVHVKQNRKKKRVQDFRSSEQHRKDNNSRATPGTSKTKASCSRTSTEFYVQPNRRQEI